MASKSTYVETLKLETIVDKTQYLKFKQEFKQDTSLSIFGKEQVEEMSKNYAKVQTKLKKIEAYKKQIENLRLYGKKDLKTLSQIMQLQSAIAKEERADKLKELFSKDGKIGGAIVDTFEKAGKAIKSFIVNAFKAAKEELSTMSTYNYGTSLFQDSTSRQYALEYGLSGSQAYALQKSMNFLGISDINDLYMMNENQRNLFAEKIGYYTDKYDSLNNSGFLQSWDRFRVEYQEFKEEMMYEIVEWIVNNKDTIKAGFEMLIKLMETTVKIVGNIANMLGFSRDQSSITNATSDIISNYQTSNKSSNVSISNTFNGIQSSNRTELINAGEMTYSQVKKALQSIY